MRFSKSLTLTKRFSKKLLSTKKTRGDWKIVAFDHVAIATKSIESTSRFFSDVLQLKVGCTTAVQDQGVNVAVTTLNGSKMELLEPASDESPIRKFVEKRKQAGIYHICLRVDNLSAAIEDIKAHSVRLLGKRIGRGVDGKPIVFLHPDDCHGILIELKEAET